MDVVAVRVVVAVLLALAGLAGGGRVVARSVSRVVAFVLLYFSLPVLTWYTVGFALLQFHGLGGVAVVGFAYMVAALMLVGVLVGVVGGRFGWDCRVGAAVTLSSVFQNSVFLPVPLALLLGGGVEPVVAYGVAFNVLAGVVVPLVAGACGSSRRVGEVRWYLRGLLVYPPFYGLLAGLATMPLGGSLYQNYGLVVGLLKGAASEATLLSFYLVGASIAATWPPRLDSAIAFTAAWRLLASPAIHLGLALPLSVEGWPLECILIESLMPPATMNLVFSEYYKLETRVVASSIALITPVSLALTALLAALTR